MCPGVPCSQEVSQSLPPAQLSQTLQAHTCHPPCTQDGVPGASGAPSCLPGHVEPCPWLTRKGSCSPRPLADQQMPMFPCDDETEVNRPRCPLGSPEPVCLLLNGSPLLETLGVAPIGHFRKPPVLMGNLLQVSAGSRSSRTQASDFSHCPAVAR